MSINTTMNIGCYNPENVPKECAGAVNLTAQWNTGARHCCPGAGEKYTAMGNKLSFCSINGGKEYPFSRRVYPPYPIAQTVDFSLPKNNPPPPTIGRSRGYSATCEGYSNTIKLHSNGFGIY